MSVNRVILFHGEIVNGFGGAERVSFELLRFLLKRKVDVKLYVFNLEKEKLVTYKYFDEIKNYIFEISNKHRITKIIKFRNIISQFKPDIVIGLYGSILCLSTFLLNIPYIDIIHGTMFWSNADVTKYSLIHRKIFGIIRNTIPGHKEFIEIYPKISLVQRLKLEVKAILDYIGVRKSKAIIVVTERVGWEVKIIYGKDSILNKGSIDGAIVNHKKKVDIKKIHDVDNKKILLSVSRLEQRKRIDLLIKSFSLICDERNDIVLIIVGDGPNKQDYVGLVKDLKCDKHTMFVSNIEDDLLWDYYMCSDLFVFPGWTSKGLTLYEALALNKKALISSEGFEERFPKSIRKSKHIFLSSPTVTDFYYGILNALSAETGDSIDLSEYFWDNSFTQTFETLEIKFQGE